MKRSAVIVGVRHVAPFWLAIFSLASCQTDTSANLSYPARPIKVIVPFAAGGGSDTFARILKRAIDNDNLIEQPLVILNMDGAGGTIGSRRVKNAAPDGYTLLNVHEALITAKHTGKVAYGPEAFEPIAGTGEVGLVVAVAKDAPYQDLPQLLAAAEKQPDSIVFSANLGAPSHFVGLLLEGKSAGVRFRYTQTGGGAKRFAALVGGHIDVSAFSIAEYLQFAPAGLRALAFFGKQRHPSAPDVPTATEQGVEMTFSNIHVWWAPKGVSQEKTSKIADVLRRAMESPATREALAKIHTDPLFITGPELRAEVARRDREMAQVAQRPEAPLPNFPAWALAAVILFGIPTAIALTGTRGAPPFTPCPLNALALQAITLCVAYVLALQVGWLGFRASTVAFVIGLGWLLTRREPIREPLPILLASALLFTLGLHYLFTQVFVIDLP